MPSPSLEVTGQPELLLYEHGLGVDCHSKFFQVCLLIHRAKQLVCREWTVPASWPELTAAKRAVPSTLAAFGINVRDDDLRYTLESTGQYHMPLCLSWRSRPSIINPSDTARRAGRPTSSTPRSWLITVSPGSGERVGWPMMPFRSCGS